MSPLDCGEANCKRSDAEPEKFAAIPCREDILGRKFVVGAARTTASPVNGVQSLVAE
jgi:hypothetical protein